MNIKRTLPQATLAPKLTAKNSPVVQNNEDDSSKGDLSVMDRVAIGGAGLVGGAVGFIPLVGMATNAGAAYVNYHGGNKAGVAIGTLGAIAGGSAFLFTGPGLEPVVAGAMIFGCLATSAIAGGLSSSMAVHSMVSSN